MYSVKVSVNFTLILEKGEDGFWIATIPEVPGAFSQGRTKSQARKNVIEALHDLMLARREIAMRERTPEGIVESLPMTA